MWAVGVRQLTRNSKCHFKEVKEMKGVEFVVDEQGRKKAVLINLKRHRQLWDDFYDTLLAKEREPEPRESLQEVKKRVRHR